jgi:general secretion pathway protein D
MKNFFPNLHSAAAGQSQLSRQGRAGSPLPAAARTKCAPYHPKTETVHSATFEKGVLAETQPRPGESKTMKNMSPILLAGLLAGWFATSAAGAPQDAAPAAAAPPPAEQSAPPANPALPPLPANRSRISNANAISGTADQGLTLNLRNVSVDQALSFLSESAGFTIYRATSTSFNGNVDVVSDTPLNKDEIVALFNKVLSDHSLTVIRDGKTLTVMTTQEASDSGQTPVNIYNPAEPIPADQEYVTEVIPVHTLNPAQVVRDLFTLIPSGAKMNTSDAGNSILMTAPQADIKRFAQIISALDSTGNGDLQVFLLTYADSKSIAQELKDVFTDTGTTGPGGAGGFNIATILGGGRGGRGGGGQGGAAGSTEDARRTGIHVNAVSDDENNAVLVSAPADYMPGISNIIYKLDIPQEDTVQIRLFFLTNAECTDVANELLTLFPDPNQSSQQNQNGRRATAQFGGFGGRGAATPAAPTMSDRLKKQVTVNAVADPRTESVLVTASKDTMDQIEKIIDEMDACDSGHVQVYVYTAQYSDVLDLLGPLTDLFPQQNGRTSSASSQQNPLLQRVQTAATQSTTSAQQTIGSTGGSGAGSGAR